MPNLGQIDPISPHESVYFIWTQVILLATVNSGPSPALFTAYVDGNFHESPWVRDYIWPLRVHEHDTPP